MKSSPPKCASQIHPHLERLRLPLLLRLIAGKFNSLSSFSFLCILTFRRSDDESIAKRRSESRHPPRDTATTEFRPTPGSPRNPLTDWVKEAQEVHAKQTEHTVDRRQAVKTAVSDMSATLEALESVLPPKPTATHTESQPERQTEGQPDRHRKQAEG